MSSIILVGGFIEVIELCEEEGYEIRGIIDYTEKTHILGYPVLGNDNDIIMSAAKYRDSKLVLVPDSPILRSKLYMAYSDSGFHFKSVISSRAHISKSANIGEGCFISHGCNISSEVSLGAAVRLNSQANVMHETSVGNFTTLAPNSVVLGRCNIGERAYIGANATVLPNIVVADDAIVGAASVVTKNVGRKVVVAGNPAHYLRDC